MNHLSRREQNRQAKRVRILDAALSVFSESGFSGASMDKIAATAGLSKPTLYHHFDSKAALFHAMMSAQRDAIMMAFDPNPTRDFVQQLHAFAWSYAGTVMRAEFLSLARLIIAEAHRFPDIGREYQNSGPDKVLKGVMTFLSAQRIAGHLSFDDSELAAEDFWGLILSAPRNRALHDPSATPSTGEIARYINNGLRTFLRAYSTHADKDLARLNHAIDAHDL